MSPESPTGSSVETITNPFRVEREHRIMLAQTRQEMQKAGKEVAGLWRSFLAFGIPGVFQRAQQGNQIVQFEASDAAGTTAWYQAKYQYSGIDKRTQPIDVFHMIKEDPDKNDAPVKMAIATYRGNNSRYSRLVALETEEAEETASGHFFYFEGNDLSIMRQSAKPQTFFLSEAQKMQFFQISRNNFFQKDLEFEVGLAGGDETTNHSYEHFGGGLVITNRLRIADPFAGTVELINISEEGIVDEPAAFNLLEAVANIGKFIPATTTPPKEL